MFSTVSMMMSASGGIVIKENSTDEELGTDSQKVQVSSIPLYRLPEEYDYFVDPPSKTETIVKDTRIQFQRFKNNCQPVLDKISHIYNTGVAHTNESIISLRDEDNYLARIGVITLGGAFGLLAARRGKLMKRVVYTAIGVGGTSAICYPQQARNVGADGLCFAKKNARIAYHFVVGSRPEVQNEDGKAFSSMTSMASDLGQRSLNMFKKLKFTPSSDKVAEKSETLDSEKEESVKIKGLPNEEVSTEEQAPTDESLIEPSNTVMFDNSNNEKPSATFVESVGSDIQTANELIEVAEVVESSVSDIKAEKVEIITPAIFEDTPAVVETSAKDEVSEYSRKEEDERQLETTIELEAPQSFDTKPIEPSEVNEVANVSEASVSENEAEKDEVCTTIEGASIIVSPVSENEAEKDEVCTTIEGASIVVSPVSENEAEKVEVSTTIVDPPSVVETSAIDDKAFVEGENVVEEKTETVVEKPVIEGDFGQGYAEDKTMYTTRD